MLLPIQKAFSRGAMIWHTSPSVHGSITRRLNPSTAESAEEFASKFCVTMAIGVSNKKYAVMAVNILLRINLKMNIEPLSGMDRRWSKNGNSA